MLKGSKIETKTSTILSVFQIFEVCILRQNLSIFFDCQGFLGHNFFSFLFVFIFMQFIDLE